MTDQDSAGPPPPPNPDRGPLGIRHLLVWTACTAAYLCVARLVFPWEEADFTRKYVGFSAADSLGAGVGLAGLLLLISCRIRRIRFPVYPGETLLVILGIQILSQFPRMVQYGLWQAGGRWIDIPLACCMLLIGLLGLIAWVWTLVAMFRARSWPWRLLFLVLVLRPGIRLFEFASFVVIPIAMSWATWKTIVAPTARIVPVAICLGFVATSELRRHPRLPWTHWAGILCGLWQTLVELAWMVAIWTRAFSNQ